MKSYFVSLLIATMCCGNLANHNRICYECSPTDEGCTKDLAGGKLNGFEKNCGKPNAHCFIAKIDDKYERGCKDNDNNADCKVGSVTVGRDDCIICSGEDACNRQFPNLRQFKRFRPLNAIITTEATNGSDAGSTTSKPKSGAPVFNVSLLCALLSFAFVAKIVINPNEIYFTQC